MYREIEIYITSVLTETNTEKLEKVLATLMEVYSIGLVSNDDYNLWLKRIQQRLMDLNMGLNDIDIGNRARAGLQAAGIATLPELKRILLGGEEKGRSFFKIRGIGVKTQHEIVWAAIEKGTLRCDDLGKNCSNKSEAERWKHMRQDVYAMKQNKEDIVCCGEREV